MRSVRPTPTPRRASRPCDHWLPARVFTTRGGGVCALSKLCMCARGPDELECYAVPRAGNLSSTVRVDSDHGLRWGVRGNRSRYQCTLVRVHEWEVWRLTDAAIPTCVGSTKRTAKGLSERCPSVCRMKDRPTQSLIAFVCILTFSVHLLATYSVPLVCWSAGGESINPGAAVFSCLHTTAIKRSPFMDACESWSSLSSMAEFGRKLNRSTRTCRTSTHGTFVVGSMIPSTKRLKYGG